MDRVESTEMINNLPEFTLAEIMEMESLYKEKGEECLTMKFCLQLSTRFSFSTHRSGKLTLHWKQVQSWFQDKHQRLAAAKVTPPSLSFRQFVFSSNNDAAQGSSPATLKQIVLSDIPTSDAAARNSQKSKRERVAELSELIFEALSSKDCAWYDVASFLNYRVVYSGELEVRVRFSGFSNEEDEWVNVRRGIRERSIPLEPSECHRIKVGDRVLCFRENDEHALYSDARILDVERNSHDGDRCSCTFVVAYDYGNAEAKVDLNQICCRPT